MKLKVFSIYDSKALAFGVPFFMASVGIAVRAFGDLANDKESNINRHPSDYILFHIGEFDDATAGYTPLHPHAHLGIGSDFISVKPPVSAPVRDITNNGQITEVIEKGGRQ